MGCDLWEGALLMTLLICNLSKLVLTCVRWRESVGACVPVFLYFWKVILFMDGLLFEDYFRFQPENEDTFGK